jgi:hypothetical protein
MAQNVTIEEVNIGRAAHNLRAVNLVEEALDIPTGGVRNSGDVSAVTTSANHHQQTHNCQARVRRTPIWVQRGGSSKAPK